MSNIITAGNATNNGTSISSDTSGVLELKTGSTPTTALTISTGQVVTVVNPIQGGTITSGTAVASTSGTSIDFTGIPSWVKRITVMFRSVSTNGSSFVQVQLGDSGGVENTGYTAVMLNSGGGSTIDNAISTGFGIRANNDGYIIDGLLNISKLTGNTYTASGTYSASGAGTGTFITSGSKQLSDTLDRVRITTVNGTDTFDAGLINILYE